MNQNPVILEARGITKTFQKGNGAVPVVRGVDLQIRQGEMIAITGASGVGKSTLLHILGTLELPTAGRLIFEGKQELLKFSESQLAEFRNRHLGFVFQFHYLLPEFTALENVMMPALISGQSRESAEARGRELLHLVGLQHRLNHRPSELSGGEQQRVAIARAVSLQPKLLLADELTGNLDSANSAMVVDLLVQLNQKTGVGILLVTHDLQLASRMHRVLSMKDGLMIQ
jgi:lipoprotein-releasing system ATP-binding protein